MLTQNVITIAAKCNTNAKCNKFSTQNVITFLTHNVMQVGTKGQSTKSDEYSINGMCIEVYLSRLLVGVRASYQIFH